MNDMIKPKEVGLAITKFCHIIGIIPSSYKLALTYEEQILAIGKYLEEEVYPAINENAEALKELQNLFVELKNYVENYFDNLDIQEEINNKLDEMAESGELTEIIAQYLELQGLLCYNTKSDLKNADNLAEGSFTKTFGNLEYNDGYGNFYKIRTLTSGDVIDDDNILALTNYPTLIAEKIPNIELQRIVSIENKISNIESNIKPINMKHVVIIGDSYTVLSGQTTWDQVLINRLGLTNDKVTKNGFSGTGFVHPSDNKTFLTLLQECFNNMSDTQKQETTHIFVCGGCNDAKANISITDMTTAISNFITYAKTNFPNAKVYVGMIGFMISPTVKPYLGKVLEAYKKCINYGGFYLNGVENVSHYYPYYLTNGVYSVSNQVHPNQEGSTAIGNGVYEALMNGKVEVFRDWEAMLTNNEGVLQGLVQSYQNDNVFKFSLNANFRMSQTSGATQVCSPSNPIDLFDFQNGSVGGVENNTKGIKGSLLLQDSSNNIHKINGYYRIISFIVGDNVAIRNRLQFVPYEPSPSTAGGYKIISNVTHYYLTNFEMDLPMYNC